MKNAIRKSLGLALAAAGLIVVAGCAGRASGPAVVGNASPEFIRVSPVSRGAKLASADVQSAISANFNGTAIPDGNHIWFSAVCKYSGATTAPITFHVANASVEFTSGGVVYHVPVPGATLVFSPGASSATTP